MKYLVFFLLASCASFQPPVYIDPAIAPYVTRFEDYYGQAVTGVSARFDSSVAPEAAACYIKWKNGSLVKRTIKIHPDVWQWSVDLGKEQLVFHELGHCELFQKHRNSTKRFGGVNGPMSIMNRNMFGNEKVYGDNHEYYMRELFDGV